MPAIAEEGRPLQDALGSAQGGQLQGHLLLQGLTHGWHLLLLLHQPGLCALLPAVLLLLPALELCSLSSSFRTATYPAAEHVVWGVMALLIFQQARVDPMLQVSRLADTTADTSGTCLPNLKARERTIQPCSTEHQGLKSIPEAFLLHLPGFHCSRCKLHLAG